MTLTEAVRLVQILRDDPSSATACAIEGWSHPVSREAAILMDLWDLEHAKAGTKEKARYPRPWPERGEVTRYGDRKGRSDAEVIEILRRHGHQPPV